MSNISCYFKINLKKKKTATLKPNLNFKKEPFQKKYLYNISFSMEHDGRNRFGRENIMYKKNLQ